MVMFSIKISGVGKTQRFLRTIDKQLDSNVDKSILEAAKVLKEEVKGSVAGQRSELKSVDTGDFLRSIQDKKEGKFNASVSTELPYPTFLEFGTRHIPERRHFRNSRDRKRREILNIIIDAVNKSTR